MSEDIRVKEVRILDPREWGLKPESIRQHDNVAANRTESWMECRSEGKPDDYYAQLKGGYITLKDGLHVVAAVMASQVTSRVRLRVEPATPEQHEAFNEFVQSQLSEKEHIDNERQYLADQLGGLGSMLIRAAQLLQEDRNG